VERPRSWPAWPRPLRRRLHSDTGRASNDSGFQQAWNLDKIGAPAPGHTTGATCGSASSTPASISPRGLAGKVIARRACSSRGRPQQLHGSGQDDVGHGTHVAGIIAPPRTTASAWPASPPTPSWWWQGGDSGGGSPSKTPTPASAGRGPRRRVVNLSLGDLLSSGRRPSGQAVGGHRVRLAEGRRPGHRLRNSDLSAPASAARTTATSTPWSSATGPDDLVTITQPHRQRQVGHRGSRRRLRRRRDAQVWSTYWEKGKQNQYGYLAAPRCRPHVTGRGAAPAQG